ncbi:hypothetical protein [Oceanivirga miroungae]|uniref:Uncharacterized protein n=1 Tax=Oceanivirga miroungae TaxID=1130046 RepID=A0A6I8MBS2_9FUSO|nr:hypothetical protein [Oceanivirga miroungae]VWL84936.1 hypothetical protein OMES3154_00209 [Oceanivirga miroungae]
MDNGQNTIDINYAGGNLQGLNRQEKAEEYFIKRLDSKIKQLDQALEKLKTSRNTLFSEDKEKEELIKSINEVKEFFSDLKSNKEFLNKIVIPNNKEIELDKDYDNDGMSNREEIKKGRDIYKPDMTEKKESPFIKKVAKDQENSEYELFK